MSQFIEKLPIILFESYCRKVDIDGKSINVTLSGVDLKLKVASTQESQSKGYMDADKSPLDNEGIIFVYDDDQPLSFWMKNVKFPLDIIFFDSSMEYIEHYTMEPGHEVEEKNLPKYKSTKPARFAVELPSGWCEKNMKPNCKLSF
jgi:uncharacterized membrane protein (UPF0127 family)